LKPYRLFVDWEVVEQLNRLPIRLRRSLRNEFLRLKEFPDAISGLRNVAKRGDCSTGSFVTASRFTIGSISLIGT
jgi:hypothetical protein